MMRALADSIEWKNRWSGELNRKTPRAAKEEEKDQDLFSPSLDLEDFSLLPGRSWRLGGSILQDRFGRNGVDRRAPMTIMGFPIERKPAFKIIVDGRTRSMRKIRLQKSGDGRLAAHFAADLNQGQHSAATAPDGYNLILAGPGSGKTRVITYRVAYLIARGVPPESIFARYLHPTRRQGDGQPARNPGRPRRGQGLGRHVPPRRQPACCGSRPGVLGFGENFTILDSEDQLDLVRLAMEDAGLVGTGKMTPKPAAVQHTLSFAFNVRRPLKEVILERNPDWQEWLPNLEIAERAYANRKKAANCMDYDDLLGQWARLLDEFPDQKAAQGQNVSARPGRRDAGHQHRPGRPGRDPRSRRLGESHGRRRRRPVDLPVPRGRTTTTSSSSPSGTPARQSSGSKPTTDPRPKSSPSPTPRFCTIRSGFPKTLVSARGQGTKPLVVPPATHTRRPNSSPSRSSNSATRGSPLARMAVLYRNHHDSILLQAELVSRGSALHRPERPPVLRAGAHQGRPRLLPDPRQPSRRARLAKAAPAPAGCRTGEGIGDLLEA